MRNILKKNIILNAIHHSGVTYPVPINLTYFWNFGILALVCLILQILTGIFLAMHYVPHADLAFASVDHIMRDINYGWLLRYLHANGASMFFLVVYVHIFRGLYYGSYTYPRQLVWCTGVAILLIMILTAFMGYVLPWGQMSFWAATVITNLVSAVPYVGIDILNWLWGGYSVDNATLNRFFSFHYLFPFILTALVGLHIVYLHENGSNNVLGIRFDNDKIPFTPYFTIKDIFGIMVFFILFTYFVFFDPVYLGHPDNFIPANPLVTPNHIVPEWYFLPFYAILRSVPDKLFGVILLLLSIIILFIFPFIIKSNIHSGYFRPLFQKFFWLFLFNCLLLGWIGGKPIEPPYYLLGQLFTIFYFLYFLIILPGISILENILYKNLITRSAKSCNHKILNRNMVKINKKKEDILNLFNYNSSFLFIIIFFIIILGSGLYMYLEGERVPNLSILICGFIGYNLLSKVISTSFKNIITNSLFYWKKIIINKKNTWLFFINQTNSILYILLLWLYISFIINNTFLNKFLINPRIIWLYFNYYNPWFIKFPSKIKTTLIIELMLFKFFKLNLNLTQYIFNLTQLNLSSKKENTILTVINLNDNKFNKNFVAAKKLHALITQFDFFDNKITKVCGIRLLGVLKTNLEE